MVRLHVRLGIGHCRTSSTLALVSSVVISSATHYWTEVMTMCSHINASTSRSRCSELQLRRLRRMRCPGFLEAVLLVSLLSGGAKAQTTMQGANIRDSLPPFPLLAQDVGRQSNVIAFAVDLTPKSRATTYLVDESRRGIPLGAGIVAGAVVGGVFGYLLHRSGCESTRGCSGRAERSAGRPRGRSLED